MGVGMFGSSCSEDTPTAKPLPGNPNKFRFEITRYELVGKVAVIMVHYPDCTNYGGNKILVFDDEDALKRSISDKELDPHFLESNTSMVARFAPTDRGWGLAIRFAHQLRFADPKGT